MSEIGIPRPGYDDEFGFTTPLPADEAPRRIPDAGFSTGPQVGERLPDFNLPDQSGRITGFHEDRDGSKAALVFFRSAVW
jgi:hypothetical protein